MKKFKFNLETVLKYRTMVEENEKNELTRLNAEMLALTYELEQLRSTYRSENSDFEQMTRNGITVQAILGRQIIIKNIEYAIESKLQEIKEQQKLITRQTAVVVRAMQERKMIEKLREKSLKRYNKAVAKEEELFINEFVSYQTYAGTE